MQKYGVHQGQDLQKVAATGCPIPGCVGKVTVSEGLIRCSEHGTAPWEQDAGDACPQESTEK